MNSKTLVKKWSQHKTRFSSSHSGVDYLTISKYNHIQTELMLLGNLWTVNRVLNIVETRVLPDHCGE